MKNIHILPTDKPSRLFYLASNLHLEQGQLISPKNYQNIYITNDEEIKEGDWMYYKHFGEDIICEYDTMGGQNTNVNEHKDYYKKIILTTDQDLIKDGVQTINDEFLEWFVKNPSCEEVDLERGYLHLTGWVKSEEEAPKNLIRYRIIIPKEELKQIKCYCGHTTYCDCGPLEEPKDVVLGYKTSIVAQMLDRIDLEEPKQETLEEAAEKVYPNDGFKDEIWADIGEVFREKFIEGAKWRQEQILEFLYLEITERRDYSASKMCEVVIEFIEQFKKK